MKQLLFNSIPYRLAWHDALLFCSVQVSLRLKNNNPFTPILLYVTLQVRYVV